MTKETKQLLVLIPLLSFAITVISAGEKCFEDLNFFLVGYFVTTFITAFLWLGNLVIFDYFHDKYGALEQTASRTIFLVIASALYTGLAYTVLEITLAKVLDEPLTLKGYLIGLRISFIATTIVTLLLETRFFFRQWEKTTFDAERLKKESIQAQLESLRNQVNPHFLFNSLNTLVSIIPEEPNLAVDFTQKLSNVYRYLLSTRERELVELASELNFIESYLFLLQVRFGENLKVETIVQPTTLPLLLPPVSLQLLIENAIKHNVVSRERPLHIRIYTENQQLIVYNNLQPKQQKEESTGVGLENIRKRYTILSELEVHVKKTDKDFTVSLPLIKM